MSLTTRRTTHRLTIEAPADLIFTVLQDSTHWPFLDGLTVYSERVSGDDADHELRTSVVVNGALNSSHCHRVFDAARHRGKFEQLDLEYPLLHLGGHWAILQAHGCSEVTLTHEFEVDEGADAELPDLIHGAVDEYSRRELDALRASSERLSVLVQQHSAGAPAREA
ncbi:SRPBCC family protein [Pseudarthrobacter sp. NamE5]|uniref:SRPBCC family protein n=1 Tax=Pseudarthrobacter sp. NamE5 TaxID=2576839 RepID=UPI00110B16C3|nr:SRPBCC family protein [Pseudarthrobacter sp. NamE5]TLM80912.1 hypothetical protein FDW84_18955 [Pseudarthrobacter sp. NamE5]